LRFSSTADHAGTPGTHVSKVTKPSMSGASRSATLVAWLARDPTDRPLAHDAQ
jgi:hypothetical protein